MADDMERERIELLPGVWLTALQTDKFKTGFLSVTLLTQLRRDTAALHAVLPDVLRRGSTSFPDSGAVAAALDGLWGATLRPVVRKYGEVQAVGFASSFADDAAAGGPVLAPLAELLCGLLLSPNTRGGLLRPDVVESARDRLLDRLRARINDKRLYAAARLIECMCSCEDYGVSRLGTEDTAAGIHYRRLTHVYHDLLAESPAEIFYCGSLPAQAAAQLLTNALAGLPRGVLNDGLGTDIRMNPAGDGVRRFREMLPVSQGKLAVGYRCGECMEQPDEAALRVFNAVFGGSVTSKLFTNVREKLSLCYYAGSRLDLHKGLVLVSSGIEPASLEPVLREIGAQLDAMRRGEITDAELSAAKRALASELRAKPDSPYLLEDYWLSQTLLGLELSPAELAALIEEVPREAVSAIARSVVCDSVYFLSGTQEEEHGA